MIQTHVALPNGHVELLALLPSSTVQDVRTKAQRAFGKKHLRLIAAKNRVLVDFKQTLEEAEIEDGECITALVLQPQLAATNSAFALWCHGDKAIVTWGDADCGGDSSPVRDQLKGTQQIQATDHAFAAILEDGSVVTWGHRRHGGDSSAVRHQLRGVQFEISSRVCSRFKPQMMPLPRFWKMDPSLPGVMKTVAVTVQQFEISSRVCSRFKPQMMSLPRFWKMDLSLPGVDQQVAVTVRKFEISSRSSPKGVGKNSADLPRLGEPAHRPEVDGLQKERGYPQVWSVDGFLDA